MSAIGLPEPPPRPAPPIACIIGPMFCIMAAIGLPDPPPRPAPIACIIGPMFCIIAAIGLGCPLPPPPPGGALRPLKSASIGFGGPPAIRSG
jgi:hypothetical protein